MKTPESKVAEQLVNLTENQWFNPAVFGRYLSEQPHYTIDRIMEMVAYILKYNHIRYQHDLEHQQTSNGLVLSNELYHAMKAIEELNSFPNLTLPKTAANYIKSLPEPVQQYRKSWIHDNVENATSINVQAVI